MSAPSAFAEATLSGEIQLGVVNKIELDMDGSTFNFGLGMEEDMGNGMTGFFYANFVHDQANEEPAGNILNDESYIGVKVDFGTVTLGNQSDAAEFACGGTDIFNYNGGAACGQGAFNDSLSNAATYANTFGAATIVVGVTIDGSNTGGANPAPGDHTIVAFNFEGEGFKIGAQMTSPDSALNIDDWTVIGGTMTFGEIVVGLTFGDGVSADSTVGVGVIIPMAGGELVAAVDTGDGIDDETNIEFHKSLSENMYAGIEFTTWDVDPDDMVGIYLEMTFQSFTSSNR